MGGMKRVSPSSPHRDLERKEGAGNQEALHQKGVSGERNRLSGIGEALQYEGVDLVRMRDVG